MEIIYTALIICLILTIWIGYLVDKWLATNPVIKFHHIGGIVFLFFVVGYITYQMFRVLIQNNVL